MRLRTDGDYAHRADTIESAKTALDENTKTAAVLAACEHARMDRRAKEKALAHPDMTEELAEILSTPFIQLHFSVNFYLETD